MGEVFIRRLREMDGKAKTGLAKALKTASEPAVLRSAFDLPAKQRAAIQIALNETFSAKIHVRFVTAPDLISGIELTTNGQKVAWSITDYLMSMEKGVDELLKEKDKPKGSPKPEAKAGPKLKAKVKPKPKPKGKAGPKLKAKAKPKPKVKAGLENGTKIQ
jgi:F-type H+-transporting ATPase subunit b